jgi:AGCS family alanine or glycine:cation symporter
MAFRFAEVYLSHKYRSTDGEESLGGPFDYIQKGFTELGFKKIGKNLAMIYAILLAIAGLCGISLFEMNQAVQILTANFHFLAGKEFLVSLLCTSFVGYVIFGGTARIGTFFSKIMPSLVALFLFISLAVIVIKIDQLPNAFRIIMNDAFNAKSGVAGAIYGFLSCMRRVVLSNETGLGTAGIIHASSTEKNSVKEALNGMISPVISGLFIIFMTAIVVVLTGVYSDPANGDGIVLLSNAFGKVNTLFPLTLVVMIPIMAMNVMIGWSNYGMKCIKFAFGNLAVKPFLIGYIIVGFSGGAFIRNFQVVMHIAETFVISLTFVNVFAVMILSNRVLSGFKQYKKELKQNKK